MNIYLTVDRVVVITENQLPKPPDQHNYTHPYMK